jgi:hypothetical protein
MVYRVIIRRSTWGTSIAASVELGAKSVSVGTACKAASITALVIARTAAARIAFHVVMGTKIFGRDSTNNGKEKSR